MGPDFPLQRIRVTSEGYVREPETSVAADCETRHFKDPAYRAKTRRTLPLITETIYEPNECTSGE